MSLLKTKNIASKWIEIDLVQFQKNTEIIKKYLGAQAYCLPIKANAYGHGMIEIAKASSSVDYFAVSSLEEGISLREAGITKPILVLGAFLEEQISELIAYDLEFSISSMYKLRLVQEALNQSHQKAFVHLKVETGMQRVGARAETAYEIYNTIQNCPNVVLKGVYSHLAHSDLSQNASAFDLFQSFMQKIGSSELNYHLLNSDNILYESPLKLNMARVGLLSFGISSKKLPDALEQVRPIFSVKSRVTYFKVVSENQGIGYGHSYFTKQPSRFVTLPVGYGDGYRRDLSNKAEVLIRGNRYPVRGNICMDQMMVEIKDGEAFVGDEVVLVGRQEGEEISILELADLCNTIPYEILCGFNQRMERFYIR